MCLLAALVRGGARTRVTHAALTFTGSPETATMATSILRGGRYGGDAGVSAHRTAKGGGALVEGPNQADCCCFLTEGAGGGACEPELVRLLPAPRHRLLGGAGEVAEHLGATPVHTTRRSSPLNSGDARIRGDISSRVERAVSKLTQRSARKRSKLSYYHIAATVTSSISTS